MNQQSVKLQFTNFLAWWGQGLLSLVPSRILQRIQYIPDYLVIIPETDQFNFCLYKNGELEPATHWSISRKDNADVSLTRTYLNEWTNPKTVIVLALPASMLLRKFLSLPLTAASNLREILTFEMDRQTPFPSDKVSFDWRELGRDSVNSLIKIELFVVLKDSLEPLLAELKHYDIYPHFVLPSDVNFLSNMNLLPEKVTRNKPLEVYSLRNLGLIALMLLFVLLYLPLSRYQTVLSDLEAQVRSVKEQADKVKSLIERRDHLYARITFLETIRKNEAAEIDILNNLTTLLPDHTWVDRLTLTKTELQLYGESEAAASLIQIIENSEYFSEVQFKAPVTKSDRNGKDRFHISAKLTNIESA